ncbi:MAG: 5-formyltetrahydrofolate cyclo-ligase [Desulfovibrio sp.]|nr:5-formyltetrahydrofolate cyclo-ligase [Desulfovibrio sp.]
MLTNTLQDPHTYQEKVRLRKILRQKRRELPPKLATTLSTRIQERFLLSKAWQQAKRIALYLPKLDNENEVDTWTLLHQALKENKSIFLPKIEPNHQLSFLPWTESTPLHKNAFAIFEPEGPAQSPPQAIDLYILPGLAFDRKGTRLGFGAGYYDQALAAQPEARVAGICYAFQLVEQLPRNSWDQNVDLICTEDELLCL